MEMIREKEYSIQMEQIVKPYLKERKREVFVSAAENTEQKYKIYVEQYETERPKGIIVISHGFTEAAPKYEEMIYYFLQAGYHVCLPEHAGHGKSYRLTSDRYLVHIDNWQRYVQDFLKVCREIKNIDPDLPLYLFAHSMGGAIGAIAASWEPQLFQKIVLSSPMIRPLTGNIPWPAVVAIAWAKNLFGKSEEYVAGHKPYDEKEDRFETSAATSEERFARYHAIRKKEEKFQTSAASYGWLLAAVHMSRYLRCKVWKRIAVPVLLLRAEQDDFVSVAALEKFGRKIQKNGKTSCEQVYFPDSRHEIYNSKDDTIKEYVGKILAFYREK